MSEWRRPFGVPLALAAAVGGGRVVYLALAALFEGSIGADIALVGAENLAVGDLVVVRPAMIAPGTPGPFPARPLALSVAHHVPAYTGSTCSRSRRRGTSPGTRWRGRC